MIESHDRVRFAIRADGALAHLWASSPGGGACSSVIQGTGQQDGGSSGSSGSSGASGSSGSSGSSSGTSGSSGSSSGTSGASGCTSGSGGLDSGPPPPPGDAAAGGACSGTTPIDATKLPWKPPTKTAGACTQAEANAFFTYVGANDAAKLADWKASVANPACRGCIFGLESAAAWSPILENTKGELVKLNAGGCIAIASGNPNCGKAYQNWFDCRFEVCSDCPDGDAAALQTCLGRASKGGCKAAFDAVGLTCCENVIDAAEKACNGDRFVFEGPIKAQCVGGIP